MRPEKRHNDKMLYIITRNKKAKVSIIMSMHGCCALKHIKFNAKKEIASSCSVVKQEISIAVMNGSKKLSCPVGGINNHLTQL